ncbi:MAG: hypothetical protein AMJ55_11465 [Gammaproteobacteria bacterium SG8_15]|jgi:hypothetical protein|nr:MAG: hypothetical protein AMJ55_11465 [Gammaproteobacteria bacterium SG8_15]
MKIAVFDTYVTTRSGALMHFDVLVPLGSSQLAENFAWQWLATIGLTRDAIELQSCQYCHSETPQPDTLQTIRRQGFAILPLEGCPVPD